MSDDINERLREKTVQIISLNQNIDTLQAQLSGSQKRANQSGARVAELEASLAERNSQIKLLESQITKTKGALETVGKEMQSVKAEQMQTHAKKQPGVEDQTLRENLTLAEITIERLREDIRIFSRAATSVLNQEENAHETLRHVLLEFGDPKYRILNMVLNRKSLRVEEIASTLVLNIAQTLNHIEALQTEGEVEVRDGHTIIPAAKYREVSVPKDEWMQLDPLQVFERLEQFLETTDDCKSVGLALDISVEVLEQKLARGGALIFQMRRTADSWKKHAGSSEELRYTIRDWKARARALT